jgi:hypothetical protein
MSILFVFSSCVFYFQVVQDTLENVDFAEGQLKVLVFICKLPLPDGRTVCRRSLAVIVGSKPARGMDVSLS